MTSQNTSKLPYLIRAMHEWMVDNGQTPYIVVNASVDGVVVPVEHIKDGKITLNISYSAAHSLNITNANVAFQARFSGVSFDVCVPAKAVMGIYAKETGQGMIFSEGAEEGQGLSENSDEKKAKVKRSHLKVVS
ncbi:uncharacterized protein METZ01_LOCUS437170 [marine metagenome]|uniref:Stringent starvation protein B n=1 Tax=marine metagenome TaxID=408172 RepID=A0A382YLZ2_9ZZZZ